MTANERVCFAAQPTVDGRRISGLALPWGVPASDRPIQFAPQSLTWEPGGPVLRLMHDGAAEQPLARDGGTMTITDSPEGLVMSAELPATTRADDALELIRTGIITSLSAEVAITARSSTTSPPTVTAAVLVALALVPTGSFDDALLFEKRTADRRRRRRMLIAAVAS